MSPTHDSAAAAATAADTTAQPAIEARGVSLSYGQTRVFSDVRLRVGANERVALIGPNGAGKTSLLRALIGLTPAQGEIHVLGEPLTSPRARARVRRRTGYVFQKHCLVRRRTALSNVIHGLLGQPGGWGAWSEMFAPRAWRSAAMAALEDVRLADKAGARADRLSGGQAQRVAIARALVARPSLVIADEPTASLDPAAGDEVMALFSGLVAERGIALLYTTHDMAHAVAHSDRVVALKDGRILLDIPSAQADTAQLAEVFGD
ncbi:MAG: phosphonate ABC transporter ATP-binding protein [Pikeienuella sp.]